MGERGGRGGRRWEEINGYYFFSISMRHPLISIQTRLIRFRKAVCETPYFIPACGEDDISITPSIDDPSVMWETGDADVDGRRAAEGHLVEPEVGAVG